MYINKSKCGVCWESWNVKRAGTIMGRGRSPQTKRGDDTTVLMEPHANEWDTSATYWCHTNAQCDMYEQLMAGHCDSPMISWAPWITSSSQWYCSSSLWGSLGGTADESRSEEIKQRADRIGKSVVDVTDESYRWRVDIPKSSRYQLPLRRWHFWTSQTYTFIALSRPPANRSYQH